MLTDAHCHLQAEEFDPDRTEVLKRCRERSMRCILVGNNLADSERAVQLAGANDECYAVVGLHPIYLAEEDWDPALFERLLHHARVVGIGEIGLDYNRIWADSAGQEQRAKQQQKEAFRAQLRFAKERHLPVVIHCRDAYDDVLTILKEEQYPRVMVHTFLGTPEVAKAFLNLGAQLSFSGIVTFDDDDALLDTVRAVPLERMMVETDSPYLTPVPFRGKRNEPMYVEEVVKKIAEVKGVDPKEVITKTGHTTEKFFGLVT